MDERGKLAPKIAPDLTPQTAPLSHVSILTAYGTPTFEEKTKRPS